MILFSSKFIKFFNQVDNKDVGIVGGKNASLGEMYTKLSRKGINVPYGFATTAYAYNYFLKMAGIKKEIQQILKGLNTHNIRDLAKRGKAVRQTILNAPFPEVLEKDILKAYKSLESLYGNDFAVAVRSSATAEDLPDASFAGQQETYLNITGEHDLLDASKKCMASLFTNRAISYRVDKKFDHFNIVLSIGVQKMVRADVGTSGVMFTIDTESGFKDVVLINAIYGLGEYIVQGRVTPDEYYVFKKTNTIISKNIGTKKEKLVYATGGNKPTKNAMVTPEDQKKIVLSDKEILKLAEWGMMIEKHYHKPMDIEWAKDGKDGKLYIVQARPETVHSQKNPNVLEEFILEKTNKSKVIVEGKSVGAKIGQGKVDIIKDVEQISKFQDGSVLVTEMTDPDWEPIMKKAAAIVTNSGGRTCHAAIVSRELGIPCVVGTVNGTEKIKNKQEITVSCAEGETGYIYKGIIPYKLKKTNLKKLKKLKTKIMINLGEPDSAFTTSFIPNDGIGLAREEFIINNYIRIHPLALIELDKKGKKAGRVKISVSDKKKIEELTFGYKTKKDFYVEKLAEGIAKIGAAFYPKDVIVRFSDFKSNEYANLIGGKYFEPKENNPMIGWRGASRYYDPKFRPAFDLECLAIRKVREEMKLKNVKVMVPFCRTIDEGLKVLEILAQNKLYGKCYIEYLKKNKNKIPKSFTDNPDLMKPAFLRRKKLKLEKNDLMDIYVMCEVPSDVILAEEFATIFDGFSIGSNDLTQLTLGVDRDSQIVSHVYDERNKAVKELIKDVIAVCKKCKTKIGICGQAPSDFPDFAKFLIEQKIDSISLTSDTVLKLRMELGRKKR
ncbi:phosphoenolpyruvate synthase [Patescibacteria group bacterium]